MTRNNDDAEDETVLLDADVYVVDGREDVDIPLGPGRIPVGLLHDGRARLLPDMPPDPVSLKITREENPQLLDWRALLIVVLDEGDVGRFLSLDLDERAKVYAHALAAPLEVQTTIKMGP